MGVGGLGVGNLEGKFCIYNFQIKNIEKFLLCLMYSFEPIVPTEDQDRVTVCVDRLQIAHT